MHFEVRRPRSRIFTTVVVLLFLGGSVPLALLGQRLSRFNRQWLEVQQQEHQLVLAEAISLELGERVRAKQAEVIGFARGLEAAMHVVDPATTLTAVEDAALLDRMLEESPDVAKLMLARSPAQSRDPGRLDFIVSERAGDNEPLAAAVEMLVTTLLDRAFAGLSVLETSADGAPVLLVVQPMRSGGTVAAALAALVRLDGLDDRLAARNERIYLLHISDRTGHRSLARSRRGARSNLLDSALVAAFRANGGVRTMAFNALVEGEEREMLGAYAAVPGIGWGVFVEVDAATAYVTVQRMRATTLGWTLGSIGVALLFGTLFARRLVKPIRELADGAMRLARGDFSRPLKIASDDEIGLLATSFNHMADELNEQLQLLARAARENEELFLASIRMLAEAIDEKDPYTRGHSERVARYAVAIATELGLPGEEVEKVQIGALLHDVGKIGIDDRILRKPTSLTAAEFETMKQHPDKGAHIMGAVAQLRDIIPGMRFHHERVDGTGYPLGLSGDEIPIMAQIISVSDTFDAMTTDRPYQLGMEPRLVVEQLRGWVGTRFRDDVVAAFASAFAAGRIELSRPGSES